MWQLTLIMLVGTTLPQPGAKAGDSTCVQCHRDLEGDLQKPVTLSTMDIHFKNGLSCDSCHGGDPSVGMDGGGAEASMNKKKGFIGSPGRKAIAQLCASCHSKVEFMRRYLPQARVDQYTEYLTSVHGQKMQAGDTKTATCSDCHGAHGIRAVSDPNSSVYKTNVASTCSQCHSKKELMAGYGIPANQVELYTRSVHGEALIKNRDLSAPTCNDCHGNHGARPPGVDSVANVCGQCHAMQWDLFNQSPHKKAFAESNMPACTTCHENHDIKRTSDAMLGVDKDAVCLNCHDKGSAGFAAAAEMKRQIVQLRDNLERAHNLVTKAERAGMEVSRPLYDLTEGKDRLVLARVEIHKFNPAGLKKVLDEGEQIASTSEKSGAGALSELAFRRKGLAISVVILLFMIGLLLIKIRQVGN